MPYKVFKFRLVPLSTGLDDLYSTDWKPQASPLTSSADLRNLTVSQAAFRSFPQIPEFILTAKAVSPTERCCQKCKTQHVQCWLKSPLALWTPWPKSVEPKSLLTQVPNGCTPLKTYSQEGHVQYSFFYVCITSLLVRATLCSRPSHVEVTVTQGNLSLWGKPSNTTSE